MSIELERKFDQIGSTFEEMMHKFGELEKKVAKGEATSDLDDQIKRMSADLSKYEKERVEIDTVLQEREAEKKRVSELESAQAQLAKELEEMAMKSGRPTATGDPDVEAHKAAFRNFICKGTEDGLAELERKAVNIGTDADGGFAVPEELDRSILDIARAASPMRSICGNVQVSTDNYERLVSIGVAASGWVDEDDARTVTDSPSLAKVAAVTGEVYANVAATQRSLDDIMFSVESWVADEVGKTFAAVENTAFTVGDGTKKPKGLMAYTTAETTDKAGTRTFGVIEEIKTGTASVIGGDDLITVVHSLNPMYRPNARWMCTGLTVAALRKLKDSEGNYLWRPGLIEGQPSTLMGYPVTENEAMAEIADSALPMAFGDFMKAYITVDRTGVRMLRDPYSSKPNVLFYSTKRVGGACLDSLSVKFVGITAA